MMMLEPVRLREQITILISKPPKVKPKQQQKYGDHYSGGELKIREMFSENSLGLEFISLGTPKKSFMGRLIQNGITPDEAFAIVQAFSEEELMRLLYDF